jgi:hypothetical protein
MKRLLRSLLRRVLRAGLEPDFNEVREAVWRETALAARESQVLLMHHYRTLARQGVRPLPTFREVGFRRYSEFDEDGILLYIFSLLPPETRRCVEICAGDGRQCNTANLIVNHGWWGVLFDGDERLVNIGKAFYARHPDTRLCPPRFVHAWITAENVNDLLRGARVSGEIDLLSLDMDGMDYWVWRALEEARPRVVVCEVNNLIPADRALTTPYAPDFRAAGPDHRGASLAAMSKLADAKGYRLVGVHRYGFNAFFVRRGLAEDLLPEVSVDSCLQDPFTRHAQEHRWPAVRDLAWVEV